MVWVGRDLKDHLIPTPLAWAGTSSTRPGCSGSVKKNEGSWRSSSHSCTNWRVLRGGEACLFVGCWHWKHRNFPPWVYTCSGFPCCIEERVVWQLEFFLLLQERNFTSSFCLRKSWVLAVLPGFVPRFGSCCLQQNATSPSQTTETDETEPHRPAVWHSCPRNLCRGPGIRTTRHALRVDTCPCSGAELSPSITLFSFASARTPHLSQPLLLLETALLPGTLGVALMGCPIPLPYEVITAFQRPPALMSVRRRGEVHPPAPSHPALPPATGNCFSEHPAQLWEKWKKGWKQSLSALMEDSVSLQWLLSTYREQPTKISVKN